MMSMITSSSRRDRSPQAASPDATAGDEAHFVDGLDSITARLKRREPSPGEQFIKSFSFIVGADSIEA